MGGLGPEVDRHAGAETFVVVRQLVAGAGDEVGRVVRQFQPRRLNDLVGLVVGAGGLGIEDDDAHGDPHW
ncbi:hypothetical protein D9M70_526900 [compost metagenome]